MILKCDECKKTLKEDVTFKESVEGTICNECKPFEEKLSKKLDEIYGEFK